MSVGLIQRLMLTVLVLATTATLSSHAEDGESRYGQVLLSDGTVLQVELADTPRRLARGYMFRDAVGPEDGMLFLLEEEEIHGFWMKNVRMPLDMLWLSVDGTVVHLEANVLPCRKDPCPSVVPMARSSRVLELAAGRAAELDLAVGSTVEFLLPLP